MRRVAGSFATARELGRCGSPVAGLAGPSAVAADTPASIVFTDVTAAAGLSRALNVSGSPDDKQFLLEEMGCGVALFDYDNDGWLDIFLVNGSSFDPTVRDRQPTSYLFHNNSDGTFTDVTRKAGLTHPGWGQGCCVGDFDNDGFDDLFVTLLGPQRPLPQQRRRHVHGRVGQGRRGRRRQRLGRRMLFPRL